MKEGWKVVKLGEVCKIGIGRTPSRSDKSLWDNEKKTNNKWVSIADMTETLNGFIYETKEHISDKAANNIAVIPKGTILLSFKLTLGKTAIAGNDLYTNEAIANLPIITNEINREYLLYYFQFFNWVNYAAGDEKVMGKTLNKKKLEILPVIYPPLPEQHRIVKKLDAAFEKIDAMKAKAEKNIENAKALFQQTLAEELEPKEGWVEKNLGEVGTLQRGGNFLKRDFIENGFPCIHYGQIHTKFDVTTYKHLTCIPYNMVREDKLASKGDLIIAITSEDVEASCKCTAWMGDYDIAIGAHTAIFRHQLNPIYVSYYFKTRKFFKEKEKYAHGFKVVEIKPIDIAKIPIVYPPLPEQQQIVTKLDNMSAKCKKLEEAERKTIAECDALKQAILRQAFNGEL